MKKLFLAFFLLPCIVKAQHIHDLNYPDANWGKVHYGILAGVNFSHYNSTFHSQFLKQLLALPPGDSISVVESVNSAGINLAGLLSINISEHFDIRTYPLNLTLTNKIFEYTLKYPSKALNENVITRKKVEGITLALPVQLKFSSDRIENFKVYMMLGGRLEYDYATNRNSVQNRNLLKLKKVDFGVETGIGFHLYFPYFVLTPELKIGFGLNDVHKRDPDLKYSNIINVINTRSLSFSVTVE